ncbi:acyltransferase family protein [Agromyces sp. NPDC055520]
MTAGHVSSTAPRRDIQALRALAVMLVVLFHFWPEVLHGGYVGVDVFFVISGFLITAHLIREIERSDRIDLPRFWARRARRLLPAALLVILVTVIAVLVWMPQFFWAQFFREVVASTLYVENWLLAADAVDYLASGNSPTAVQHYWSLSVEEQFYLVWPLLLLLAAVVVGKVGSGALRRGLGIAIGIVLVASLATSILMTASDSAAAYFVTPTRAWEFALGAMLAVLPVVAAARLVAVRAVIGWLGWIAIAYSAWTFSAATPFPGSAALVPVLGTAAVIWANEPRVWWSSTALTGIRPIQWVGDVSYSAYLWHWPLILIAPYVIGQAQLSIVVKGPLVVLTLVLAWATKRWVEDPVRTGRLLSGRRPVVTFGAAGMAMIIVVAPALVGLAFLQARIAADDVERSRLAQSACFGAASLDDPSCSDATFDVISPDPAAAPQDSPGIYFTDPPCFASGSDLRPCTFGDPESSKRVALIGDSHAAQWQPALAEIAEEQGWRLDLYLKTNCAFTSADRGPAYDACADWSGALQQRLEEEAPYALVLTSFFAENLGLEVDAGTLTRTQALEGFRDVWAPLIERGSVVAAIADTPHMLQTTTVCVATSEDGFDECAVPRSIAFTREDLQVTAAEGLGGASVIDMVDHLCRPDVCPAVVGGVAMYTDPYHLTETYSRTTAPFLLRGIDAALAGTPTAAALGDADSAAAAGE